MIALTLKRLAAVRSMPWRQALARLALRSGLRSDWVQRQALLASPRARDPLQPVRIMQRALDLAGLGAAHLRERLSGTTVLELGAGQAGGLGIAAAVLGAQRYAGVDPGINTALWAHAAVRAGFLQPALRASAGEFGVQAGDADLAAAFDTRCRYHAASLEDAAACGDGFDTVISISCLEHIGDLCATLAALERVCSAGAVQLHVVNFGNHTDRARPFSGLYEQPRDDYVRAWGGHVNGLRAPDVLALFAANGMPLELFALDVRPDALPASVHSWWSERYSAEDLAIRTALLVTPAGNGRASPVPSNPGVEKP